MRVPRLSKVRRTALIRHVLAVFRQREGARFQDKNPPAVRGVRKHEGRGDCCAKRSSSNDNGVKAPLLACYLNSATIPRFLQCVAEKTAHVIEGKSGFLYCDRVRSFLEIANHVVLLRADLLGRGDRILGLACANYQ